MARPKGKYQKPVPVELTCAYVGCSETFKKRPTSPKRFCTPICGAREYWRIKKIVHAYETLSAVDNEVFKTLFDNRNWGANKKTFFLSTPTLFHQSIIDKEYNKEDNQ